jgi:hypothetical protein
MQLLNLSDAFEKKTGRRPNPCTTWRWSSKGVKGVKLQVVFMGGTRLTTEEWVQDFMDAVSRANMAKHEVAPMQTPRQQDRNAEQAAKKLAKRLKPGAAK